jgi:hypothetical protein
MPDILLVIFMVVLFAVFMFLFATNMQGGVIEAEYRGLLPLVFAVLMVLVLWFFTSVNCMEPYSIREHRVETTMDGSQQYIALREGEIVPLTRRMGRILPKDAVVVHEKNHGSISLGIRHYMQEDKIYLKGEQ